MIIYFCDRQMNILGQASTELSGGFRISNDKNVEDVESGVNTFECVITWTDDTRSELEDAIVAGNYILKSNKDDNNYNCLYQIVEAESDTKAQEIRLYSEDAGLDLLNKICGAATLSNKTITQMLAYFAPGDWTINVQDAPTTTKSNKWEGDSSCTERLRSVVGLWNCELYYSFDIEQLQVKDKIINVVKKRGRQEAIPQLKLNYDIDRIVTKTSIADMVTALAVTGGTLDGSDTPINLKNYTYNYTDPDTGDQYTVHKATGQMRNITAMDEWSSMIDTDGLFVGSFTYDTTDKAVLAGQARAELQKLSKPAVNYEVDFAKLPDDVQVGDRVNIIDDDGGLYLEARILKIETCEAEDTQTATIGEYLLKTSGIADKVQALAEEMAIIKPTYVWVAYADDASGTNISKYPTGKTYMGIAANRSTAEVDISDPSVYTWSKIKGEDGSGSVLIGISSSAGTIFKTTKISTILTAHVYQNGAELSQSEIAELGTIKWYINGVEQATTGTELPIPAPGQQPTLERATIKAQLED